jgi:hypothetical protein
MPKVGIDFTPNCRKLFWIVRSKCRKLCLQHLKFIFAKKKNVLKLDSVSKFINLSNSLNIKS